MSCQLDELRVHAARLGFLADAYDLFAIDLVVLIFDLTYGREVFDAPAKSLVVTSMLVGIVLGQLTFGYIADWFGRRKASVATAGLVILGALASASTTKYITVVSYPVQLASCRFLMGLGVGGEYPLSATITAEAIQDDKSRRVGLASVIAMQGFGMLLSSCVVIACLLLNASLELTWRIAFAFGAGPSLLAFVIRWHLPESEEFTHAQKSGETNAFWNNAGQLWRPLLGTCLPWFLMNIFQYSIGSFKSSILGQMMFTPTASPSSLVLREAGFSALISLFAIAGFAAGIKLLHRMPCPLLQSSGFALLIGVFVCAGLACHATSGIYLLPMLGLMFFFLNAGPNLCTFIVPAEVYPTIVRATCCGISSACGKFGAAIGTFLFAPAQEKFGMEYVFAFCALAALAGAITTNVLLPRAPLLLQADVTAEIQNLDAGGKPVSSAATYGSVL